MGDKTRISVMVSGGGTNLQAIIDHIGSGFLNCAEIVQVISSKEGVYALERAQKAGIETIVIPPKQKEKLLAVLGEAKTDLIVLAGYMSILAPEVIAAYRKRIINIHPSLIPKYCGTGFYGERVHKAVIEAGEIVSGATVHFVDEGVDTGKIILQREVAVKKGDDAKALAARVLEVEHQILPEAIKLFCEGKI